MEHKPLVGWQEWVSLPKLKLDAIKAKVDTGAKTCALHAYYVEPYEHNGQQWVRFGIHPHQGDLETTVECHAPLADQRKVTDSGGHTEERYVIRTCVHLNNKDFETEITLTNRDTMQFRMLLGRNLLNNNFAVDPVMSFLASDEFSQSGQQTKSEYDENSDLIEE